MTAVIRGAKTHRTLRRRPFPARKRRGGCVRSPTITLHLLRSNCSAGGTLDLRRPVQPYYDPFAQRGKRSVSPIAFSAIPASGLGARRNGKRRSSILAEAANDSETRQAKCAGRASGIGVVQVVGRTSRPCHDLHSVRVSQKGSFKRIRSETRKIVAPRVIAPPKKIMLDPQTRSRHERAMRSIEESEPRSSENYVIHDN